MGAKIGGHPQGSTSFDLAPATASQLLDLSHFTLHQTISVPRGRSVFFAHVMYDRYAAQSILGAELVSR